MPRQNYKKYYPKIILDWSYVLNDNLNPNNVKLDSVKKYFWKCHKQRCGKVWKDTMYGRVVLGRGCPVCEERAKKRSTLDVFGINKKMEKMEKLLNEMESDIGFINNSENTNKMRSKKCFYISQKLNKLSEMNIQLRELILNHKKNEIKKGKNGFNDVKNLKL
jgi:hypothetical protein